jgi:hypothetical protein
MVAASSVPCSFFIGGGDEDFGAGLEFPLVSRHVGHDGRVRRNHDLLLSVPVFQRISLVKRAKFVSFMQCV